MSNNKVATNKDLARVFRAKSGRIIAALVANCHDLQLAEDALQDAVIQASEQWAIKGVPTNTSAWLFTTAKRRLIDRIRHTAHTHDTLISEHTMQALSPERLPIEDEQSIPDERLKLIFTCCHPALSLEAQIALTLKTLCGLSSKEIARAFLTAETTMNQRIVRAKRKIKTAGIPYEIPEDDEISRRIDSVLSVIYLIFNESYSAYEGQTLTRQDLALEAIRLARILNKLMPTPPVMGLLSLLLIHHARSPARSSQKATFIPLEKQDRSLWDQTLISEGRSLLLAAMAKGQPDKHQIQAAISALHAEAKSWQETDWKQILLLYLSLLRHEPSPTIELNMLIALAQSGKQEEALTRIYELGEKLEGYQPYYAARASLEHTLGKNDQARASYEKAISLTKNTPERDFLERQSQELS